MSEAQQPTARQYRQTAEEIRLAAAANALPDSAA
jgi:hypothetical protein